MSEDIIADDDEIDNDDDDESRAVTVRHQPKEHRLFFRGDDGKEKSWLCPICHIWASDHDFQWGSIFMKTALLHERNPLQLRRVPFLQIQPLMSEFEEQSIKLKQYHDQRDAHKHHADKDINNSIETTEARILELKQQLDRKRKLSSRLALAIFLSCVFLPCLDLGIALAVLQPNSFEHFLQNAHSRFFLVFGGLTLTLVPICYWWYIASTFDVWIRRHTGLTQERIEFEKDRFKTNRDYSRAFWTAILLVFGAYLLDAPKDIPKQPEQGVTGRNGDDYSAGQRSAEGSITNPNLKRRTVTPIPPLKSHESMAPH